jgi:hypothetical protein
MPGRVSVVAIDGYVRISLPVSELPYPVIYADFMGRWLVGHGMASRQERDDLTWNRAIKYSIAQTQQGRIVVFTREEGSTNPDTGRCSTTLRHFASRPLTADVTRHFRSEERCSSRRPCALRVGIGCLGDS